MVAPLLLANGADHNAINVDGATPLHVVCMGKNDGYYRLANWLIEASQPPNKPLLMNVRDKRGNAPLHLALDTADPMLAELLQRHGAELHLPNDELYTPLHGICKRNSVGHVGESLLGVCSEKLETLRCVDLRDKYDNTPLHLALRRTATRR
ncbi:tankyrase-1-like [Trichogramma pretiosum]|uniref:tankyrase-1-like n=1 Tax=Trichogramma pretiosum TaxID=7493 RepID=UPI0006C95E4F|nr:tankyrase-1-like [Trichogramma pretiosum]